MLKKIIFIALLFVFKTNAQSFKTMTYNIRLDVTSDGKNSWSNRKDYFVSQVKFYEPDIIGFQEVLPNQLEYLASSLVDYSYIAKGREENGEGEASAIFYKKDRYRVVDSNTFWLSETPEVVSKGWDAACTRVCTYALLKDNTTGKSFLVFNTHLDHVGQVARMKGMELILSNIEKINSEKYPVVLMGDFNSTPDNEVVKHLKTKMDDSRSVSISEPFGPSGTFNKFEHNKSVKNLIDYIFVSKNSTLIVLKYAVLSDSKDLRYPSDHLPVFAEIEFK